MPWTLEYYEDREMIETRYLGILSGDDLQACMLATVALGQEKRVSRFLGDCTQLLGGHSVVDLYRSAQSLAEMGGLPHFKEAVLLPQGQTQPAADARFWETTSRNRGMNVRLFEDRAEAIGWLMQD